MSDPTERARETEASIGATDRLPAMIGERYRIERRLGEGGMATVFLAEDLKHHRKVAVKVLQGAVAHTIGIRRFLLEIEVVARLQHPHLLTLIDSGDLDGVPYYVMPYVEALSLRDLLAREGRLPIDRAVAIAREVADGLHFAHQHGVIHRDIKPANILMSADHAMVADFGIASALHHAGVGRLTETGISLGSPTYMSPEQAAAERDLDARTDVYSLSCVLYEMLCGEPPIDSASMQQVVTRKLTGRFAPLRERCPDVPPALEAAVHRGLATERDARFATAQEFRDAIAHAIRPAHVSSRRLVLTGAAAALVALLGGGAWIRHERRVLAATQQVAEIDRLVADGQFAAAFERAEALSADVQGDTMLRRIRPEFTDFVHIVTAPAGARVSRQRIGRGDAAWEPVGTTPLDSVPMPKQGSNLSYRLRIERDGYRRVELLPHVFVGLAPVLGATPLDTVRLDPLAAVGEGMVRIPGWSERDTLHAGAGQLRFADYHIGRTEVTNREYARFVAAGGYRTREYWTEPFVRDGRPVAWEAAMAALHDRTGMPGPSTWSGGAPPAGQEEFPVGGVSYYEAAAYARFAGRQLPTSAHWARAVTRHARETSWIYLPSSNLKGTAPRPVGRGEMNAMGLHDVAGNVREWCVNPVDSGRLTRGAGWADDEWHTGHLIARPEFDRSPDNGLRLVALTDADTTLAHLAGRIVRRSPRDYREATPVGDAEFAFYRRLYDYDALPLDARRDSAGVSGQFRWERVSFTAAYGGERMAAFVFLPMDARPPYQTILLWPHDGVHFDRVFDPARQGFERRLAFLPRSGRAFVLPVFKATLDRREAGGRLGIPARDSSIAARDLRVQQIKDLRRTVDYLQTRDDVRAGQLGYYGVSWGGAMAPLALALEPRLRAAVLWSGGLNPTHWTRPEVDPLHFAPRVHTPTLMLNGRHDVVFPYAISQLPLLRLLGTPAADKKNVAYPASHFVPHAEAVRETLAWFDKYLGPVTPRP